LIRKDGIAHVHLRYARRLTLLQKEGEDQQSNVKKLTSTQYGDCISHRTLRGPTPSTVQENSHVRGSGLLSAKLSIHIYIALRY